MTSGGDRQSSPGQSEGPNLRCTGRGPIQPSRPFPLRRRALLTALPALAPATAVAQPRDYPSRPVTLTIGYAPGALTDIMVRMLAERLARELGQPVLVENRAGAGTALASTAVAAARPDGYALLIGTNSLAINVALNPATTPRDPLNELLPVREVYYSPFLLLVHRDLGARTLPELVAAARRAPRAINYGSSGIGAVNHLLTELLVQRAGAPMTHVPYRGGGPALVALRAGEIGVFYATPLDARPILADGLAHPVAISSPERLATLPDVPSVAESYSGCDGVLWQGLFAPVGTPAPIVARLAEAMGRVLDDPSLRARVADQGVVLMQGDAAALRERLRGDIATWAQVVRESGIKPE